MKSASEIQFCCCQGQNLQRSSRESGASMRPRPEAVTTGPSVTPVTQGNFSSIAETTGVIQG